LLNISNQLQARRILTIHPPVRRLKPGTLQIPPPTIATKIATKTKNRHKNHVYFTLLYTRILLDRR
jgi:hypothetical protein